MHSLIESCNAVFGCYPWDNLTFFFLKGNRGAVNLRKWVGGNWDAVVELYSMREEEILKITFNYHIVGVTMPQ